MLQLVITTAEENVTRERERLRLLIDSIHKSQAVLMNRMSILRNEGRLLSQPLENVTRDHDRLFVP